jgi:hypothetical protein
LYLLYNLKLIIGENMRNIDLKPISLFILSFIILSINVRNLSSQDKSPVMIKVNASVKTGPVEPIWNGIGGSLGLALTPQGDRLLGRIDEAFPYP